MTYFHFRVLPNEIPQILVMTLLKVLKSQVLKSFPREPSLSVGISVCCAHPRIQSIDAIAIIAHSLVSIRKMFNYEITRALIKN